MIFKKLLNQKSLQLVCLFFQIIFVIRKCFNNSLINTLSHWTKYHFLSQIHTLKIFKNMSMIQHRITDKFVWKASISKITNKDFSILHNRFCDYTLLFLLISIHYYYAKHFIDAVAFHTDIKHFTYALIIMKLTNAQSWLCKMCVALADIVLCV